MQGDIYSSSQTTLKEDNLNYSFPTLQWYEVHPDDYFIFTFIQYILMSMLYRKLGFVLDVFSNCRLV